MSEDTGKYDCGSIWWRSLGLVRSLNSNLSDIFIELYPSLPCTALIKYCLNKKYLLFFQRNESFLSSNVDRKDFLVFEEVNNGSEP